VQKDANGISLTFTEIFANVTCKDPKVAKALLPPEPSVRPLLTDDEMATKYRYVHLF
jgi:hypothetical protein